MDRLSWLLTAKAQTEGAWCTECKYLLPTLPSGRQARFLPRVDISKDGVLWPPY